MEVAEKDIQMAAMESLVAGHEVKEVHFQMNSPTFSACGDMRNEDGAHADIVQEH